MRRSPIGSRRSAGSAFTARNFAGNFEHDNNDVTFGAGLAYQFTANFGLRGEWQRYRNVGGGDVALGAGEGQKSNVDVFSIGALWRF